MIVPHQRQVGGAAAIHLISIADAIEFQMLEGVLPDNVATPLCEQNVIAGIASGRDRLEWLLHVGRNHWPGQ